MLIGPFEGGGRTIEVGEFSVKEEGREESEVVEEFRSKSRLLQ